MFIIGLELRPQRLWEMRKSIFVMGSLQVMLCGVLLACIVFFALQQQIAASVVIGFALALSSTAFVLQLLSEKQQLNTTFGQQSFSDFTLSRYCRDSADCGHSPSCRDKLNPSWRCLLCSDCCHLYRLVFI